MKRSMPPNTYPAFVRMPPTFDASELANLFEANPMVAPRPVNPKQPVVVLPESQHPLGWHPPLAYTHEDMQATYYKDKNQLRDLPNGLVASAIRMGRNVSRRMLYKALSDLMLELKALEDLLVPPSFSDGPWEEWERHMYVALLHDDFRLVENAIKANKESVSYGIPKVQVLSETGSRLVNVISPNPEPSQTSNVYAQLIAQQNLSIPLPDTPPPEDNHPSPSPLVSQPPISKEDASKDPQENDVIMGRGKKAMRHRGNVEWRLSLLDTVEAYEQADAKDRKQIVQNLVARVRDRNGRFLRKDPKTEAWVDIGDRRAAKKATQGLRDMMREHDQATICESSFEVSEPLDDVGLLADEPLDDVGPLAEEEPRRPLKKRKLKSSHLFFSSTQEEDDELAALFR